MDITFHGYGCFSIKTKEGSAVINPYRESVGLKLPPLKANFILKSSYNEEGSNVQAVSGEPKILDWPGEYEVAGVAITSNELKFSDPQKKQGSMIYMLVADGVKICYMSDIDVVLSDEFVEEIGQVDILILPIGADKDAYRQAHQFIEEIEPRVVIPMHYKTPGLTLELEQLDNFAKQAGITALEPKDIFSVNSKSDLPQDKIDYVVLNPKIA